jgi:hypothetical protein
MTATFYFFGFVKTFAHRLHRLRWLFNSALHFGQRRFFSFMTYLVRGRNLPIGKILLE